MIIKENENKNMVVADNHQSGFKIEIILLLVPFPGVY